MNWQLGQGRNIRLFGLDIFDTTISSAANWLVKRAKAGIRTDAAFMNAHYVNVSHHDKEYRSSIAGFDRLFADGVGVRIAAKIAGVEITENVNGTDLLPMLCLTAERHGVPIFFLGSKPDIAEETAYRLKVIHPRLIIAGTHHGYLDDPETEHQAIEMINESGAGLLLVGMGVPGQEVWIARNRSKLAVPAILAVGGLFDFYSGRMPRAPLPLRQNGLEWAWRLALEPRRMWKRYLIGNVEFLARTVWQAMFRPELSDQKLASPLVMPASASTDRLQAAVADRGAQLSDTRKAA